ncbi:Amino-acid permease INDA1 [Sporothrix schenckii 1099-18]|uniref:Amino-acid permease inda1 n=2 Tax=Sporothrix schenckii TaxID=29908 RepID=U7Q694_SPOS1|nr:Amino-acid permease INDA1 [Sporothrix schenckii 1099-18]ERT03358.1 amino-acid permease inda1 [Sporothrix schenckii ATCC 58251]KJR84202.1 Amino-acid permease INDA1 [Sporothrix schenckii 1099-18]
MSDKEELGSANGGGFKEAPNYDLSQRHSNVVGTINNEAVLPEGVAATPGEEPLRVRLGLSTKSFHKRHYGPGIVELDRRMKPRHLNMIAIGGSIGAGFFVGSGSALHTGGPGFLLIDFLIIGVMMFNVVYALGELAVMYPVSGGFYTYSARFIDPTWGFAMGWNYVMQWAAVLPLELTVCSLTVAYWNPDINHAAWISMFLGLIIIINIFGTLGYAEEEFWASVLKLSATVIFMIIAFVLVLGGGPSSGQYNHYWGARLWHDPGAFQNGFRGFCSVFVTAAFSFSGTELVGLAAAEAHNPVKALPSAIKQVFWRITLFYILGLFFVGLLVSSTDDRLLGANPYADINASPFVLVGKYAGLKGFDDFMNVIILVSVLSIGVASVYGGSRTLTALAQQGYAPRIFTYIDRSGRPLFSVIVLIMFGFLAYISLAAAGSTVFDWLLALSGLAALFTWGSICLAHIRFRSAWKYHGHTLDEIPFKAIGGVVGSYIGLGLNIIVLIAQLFTAIAPVGGGVNDAQGFFKSFLAFPLVIAFWIGGYIWKRRGWLRTSEIDVDSGRRALDWDAINEYRASLAKMGPVRRMFHTVFL